MKIFLSKSRSDCRNLFVRHSMSLGHQHWKAICRENLKILCNLSVHLRSLWTVFPCYIETRHIYIILYSIFCIECSGDNFELTIQFRNLSCNIRKLFLLHLFLTLSFKISKRFSKTSYNICCFHYRCILSICSLTFIFVMYVVIISFKGQICSFILFNLYTNNLHCLYKRTVHRYYIVHRTKKKK